MNSGGYQLRRRCWPRLVAVGEQAGFSLLEVLVAFSILALSLGVLMQVFSGSMRNALLSEQYSRATLVAQSRLATAGIERPLVDGGSEGETDDGMHWRLMVSAYQPPPDADAGLDSAALEIDPDAGPVQGWLVTVRVSWQDNNKRRDVELHSLRISRRER